MQRRHPGVDVPRLMRKLGEEVGELAEAVALNDNKLDITQEVGDCALVLAMILITLDSYSLTAIMSSTLDLQEERLRNGDRKPDVPLVRRKKRRGAK